MTRRTGLARAVALAMAGLLGLAGCSSDRSDRGSALGELQSSVRNLLGERQTAAEGITLTDAQLNAAPVDVMRLSIPAFGTEVGLVPQAVNRDVATWVTPEGYSVALRGGQVVGTAGFGFDMESASVPDLRSGASQVVRTYYRLMGDESVERSRYVCDLARRPGERITVTSRAFVTTRIDERCTASDADPIKNVYWIDERGIVRQSRQFISPRLGYFELQDIHGGLR